MTTGEVKTTAARQAQSKADKLDVRERLLGKTKRTKTLDITLDGESFTMIFRALSSKELDALRAKHKPTPKQITEGYAINVDTFSPALVAATLIDPVLNLEDVKELFASENWSSGELGQLFEAASSVCQEGIDIPFSATV